ncbi:hypothetical protein Nepgr_024754 [Nepenthes gracilis]|uniref:Uncharacterized protein n=1 Tax=Nepenthes gracilis TaxID=150966 RepID=A0AAD3T6I2_NEPGR|nr:hypothetical protein Nepgr_024754 [Nepenthes gracilis]
MRSFPLMLLDVMYSSPHGGNLVLIHLQSADVPSSSRMAAGMFDHDLLCSGDAHGVGWESLECAAAAVSLAGVGVWCVAVGFCFYVKVLLLCSTAEDGAAGLGAGAF